MDSMGTLLEGEWSCFSGMYTTDQEADFMAQLLRNCPRLPDIDMSNYLSDSNPVFVTNNSPVSTDFCMEDGSNTSFFLVKPDDCFNPEMGMDGNVEKEPKPEPEKKSSNKRSRNSGDVHVSVRQKYLEKKVFDFSSSLIVLFLLVCVQVQKTKRNGRSKKNQTLAANDDEDGNGGLNGQSWASCSSEDDSNGGVSSGSKGETALNLNGKTRASRGAATDPQCLYARVRNIYKANVV